MQFGTEKVSLIHVYHYFLFQSVRVNISGICEHNWQCNGTELANVCDDGLCVCNSGYVQNEKKCYKGKTFQV